MLETIQRGSNSDLYMRSIVVDLTEGDNTLAIAAQQSKERSTNSDANATNSQRRVLEKLLTLLGFLVPMPQSSSLYEEHCREWA